MVRDKTVTGGKPAGLDKHLMQLFVNLQSAPGFALCTLSFDDNGLPDQFVFLDKGMPDEVVELYHEAMLAAAQDASKKMMERIAKELKEPEPERSKIIQFSSFHKRD